MTYKRKPYTQSQTVYIDGLRGILSVIIFNAHLTPLIILGYDNVSGQKQSIPPRDVTDIPLVASCVKHWDLFTIPIVKLAYSASPAVSMFFAISGYVMSLKWICYIDRSPTTFPTRIFTDHSSSVFRRTLRLTLISMASMIMPFILCKTGYFDRTVVQRHGLTRLEPGFRFWLEQWDYFPARQENWWAQACDLVQNCGRLFTIFTQRSDELFPPRYNPVLWTIKADLRASLAFFATQVALLGSNRHCRLLFLVALVALGWGVGSLECPLFWAGWIIAELHHSADQVSLKQRKDTSKSRQKTFGRGVYSVGKTAMLSLGCYIASYPTWKPSKASMFAIVRAITPGIVVPPRTWHSIGVVVVLYSLRNVSLARRLCECSVSQFLGAHSFAIYLVHFCIIVCFGPDLFSWVWSCTGYEHPLPFAIGFGVTYVILLTFVLLASAIFRYLIELPLNKCIESLYQSAFVQSHA
jgi:peptidoglycan/LPS O-acetylase OafA/YrhL